MLFNSLEFLLFFPIVVAFYFALPQRFRWMFLLGASYYFYMAWKPEYVILIILSTLVDYYAALRMGRATDKRKRKKYLVVSLVANLGLLFSFKYFNFFSDSLRDLLAEANVFYDSPALDILLPVGISFYTFQTLSYTIDVYRGARAPERHLGIFALYVSFFPQLVAGPIERSTRLLPQFFRERSFDYERALSGLRLMLWGFFKKLVIADRLAVYVNAVYNNPGDYTGAPVILATYFFAIQIYCDFSGYSDIAIGAARVMGYDLMENFRRPYFSKSIGEFWKRWHISLSSWFKDYLYLPLGGNRVAKWRWLYNLLAVFLISGLWHGANWTFLAWGGLHGSYLALSKMTAGIRRRFSETVGLVRRPELQRFVRVFVTFHLTLLAWVFFRANSLADAFTHLEGMLSPGVKGLAEAFGKHSPLLGWIELFIAFSALALLALEHVIARRQSPGAFLSRQPLWARWFAYQALIVSTLLFGVFSHAEFIYFQF
ncbi:MAG: MBOAT family O-acyltransferase [Candidatus Zixiibacteriota bacterium]